MRTRRVRDGRGGREARRIDREAVVDEVVLGQPDLVEAQLLRPLHLLDLAVHDLGVGEAGGGLEEEEGPEAHGSGDYSAIAPASALTPPGGAVQYARRRSPMETRVDEIAERIYRLSTFLPAVGPRGLTFNQFLVDADEPPALPLRPARSTRPSRRRRRASWTSPAALDHLQPRRGRRVRRPRGMARRRAVGHRRPRGHRLRDLAQRSSPRPPRALANDEVLDLGGRRVRRLDTPHVPHCWDAGLLYEETTGTLFSSDLFTHAGDPAPVTGGDIVGPATVAEEQFGFTAVSLGDRRHHPTPGRARAAYPGGDARLVVLRRGGAGARVARRLLRRPAPERRVDRARLAPRSKSGFSRCAG